MYIRAQTSQPAESILVVCAYIVRHVSFSSTTLNVVETKGFQGRVSRVPKSSVASPGEKRGDNPCNIPTQGRRGEEVEQRAPGSACVNPALYLPGKRKKTNDTFASLPHSTKQQHFLPHPRPPHRKPNIYLQMQSRSLEVS